jgi:cytochrome c
MKSISLNIALVIGVAWVGNAMAVDMPELAKKSNCVACHTIDKKLVGPAWQEIAAKYKGDKGAVASLGSKIIAGGKGVWGPVPMPPNPKLAEADAKELATFIMGLAK